MKDIFTDEWYVVTGGEYGEDEVSRDFQPWVEIHIEDYVTFGEMLKTGLSEANKFLKEAQNSVQFRVRDDLGEEVYSIY